MYSLRKRKACWLAKQTSKGWRLKLCVGNKEYPIRGLLTNMGSIRKIAKDLNVVYVHMDI